MILYCGKDYKSEGVNCMKCPYCNKEMEYGAVQSARDIFWGEKKHKLFFKPGNEKEFILANGWNGCAINAYCCRDCEKIIIDF